MAKKILLVVLVALSVALFLSFGEEEEQSTPADKLKIRCSHSVPVKLGEYSFTVPRTGYTIMDSEKNTYLITKNRNCHIKEVNNAMAISAADSFLIRTADASLLSNGKLPTRFNVHREDFNAEDVNEMLQHKDFTVWRHGKRDSYFVSNRLIPTKNMEPVLVLCDKGENDHNFLNYCKTSYLLPSGLILSYTYPRKKFPRDLFMDADKYFKEKLESLRSKNPEEENSQ